MRMENEVETTMRKEIDELSKMPVGQLRQKYLEVFGEESRSNHKQFLFRRIAWRIQAIAEGGLSERARRRALEIANDADLRVRAPKTTFGPDAKISDLAQKRLFSTTFLSMFYARRVEQGGSGWNQRALASSKLSTSLNGTA